MSEIMSHAKMFFDLYLFYKALIIFKKYWNRSDRSSESFLLSLSKKFITEKKFKQKII